jgi:hydroxymethylglutaryl-CoA lyase
VIRIIEVGPRDGLQNEATPVPTEAKLSFIAALANAGLREIEATSFVSPKWVPQLGDAGELLQALRAQGSGHRGQGCDPEIPNAKRPTPNTLFSALVPNLKGLGRAIDVGVKRIALFTAASDAFTQKNINMSVDQSLEVFAQVLDAFRSQVPDGWVRGYVSTAFECPYAGLIEPKQVVSVSQRLLDMGVDEISLGDTIGVAVPKEVRELTKAISGVAPREKIAYHFHDTRGTAIANVACAYEDGIRAFDSSAGGLGGCPYAPGAGGNLATEDLVYFLERSGIPTGVDLLKLSRASLPILQALGRPPSSKAQLAVLASASGESHSK